MIVPSWGSRHRATQSLLLTVLALLLLAARIPVSWAASGRGDGPDGGGDPGVDYPYISWGDDQQEGFTTALCRDSAGSIWVGTEGDGLWRYTPPEARKARGGSVGKWTHVTHADGLGEDTVYALACDQQGRIWAGHAGHGVSVFDGHTWKCYPPGDGPLGGRVYAIACCPTDGDVWIGTEAGLTRYAVAKDRWTQYTAAWDGLPFHGASALAFAPGSGDLYVGTPAEGVCVAARARGYREWRRASVQANHDATMLRPPVGDGIPSDLVNAVLIARDGTAYAGTDGGLAQSGDGGRTWRFLRAGDEWGKAAGAAPDGALASPVLSEGYVTCLAEDALGRIWIGHRQTGYDVLDPRTHALIRGDDAPDSYVKAILPTPCLSTLLARYGRGFKQTSLETLFVRPSGHPEEVQTADAPAAAARSRLPAPDGAPSPRELQAMLSRVRSTAAPGHAGDYGATGRGAAAALLDEDWQTRGDWLGRYGRYWACLAAVQPGRDLVWGAGQADIPYAVRLGPNHDPGDVQRYFVHALYTKDPRTLELPAVYLDSRVAMHLTDREAGRRQSVWDDHGEGYPMGKDGPDLLCTVAVPAGAFRLSAYFINPDAHEWLNPYRDYTVTLRRETRPEGAAGAAAVERDLVRTRVHDFWSGTYVRFLVRGPARYTVAVGRNHSINTILAGLFLDTLEESPSPYPHAHGSGATTGRLRQTAAALPEADTAGAAEAAALFRALLRLRGRDPIAWAGLQRIASAALLRWYRAHQPAPGSPEAAYPATLLFQMDRYEEWEAEERRRGIRTARDIEEALRWDAAANPVRDRDAVTAYLHGTGGSRSSSARP